MDVYWFEQSEADVPPENDWLSAGEEVRLNSMRFAKRRADWRLGRWTAKCALAAYLNLPRHSLAHIEIRAAASGAPEVLIGNKAAEVTISLSHRGGVAICAVAPSGVALGCDLEMIEPRSDAFVADYFTTEEQALVAQTPATDRSRLLALLWAGKESALKALRAGLRLDTRSVTVNPVDGLEPRGEGGQESAEDPPLTPQPQRLDGWHLLHVRHTHGQVFHGWWQHTGDHLRTVVAAPPPGPPILLKIPSKISS